MLTPLFQGPVTTIDHNITSEAKLQQHQCKCQYVLKAVHHQTAIRHGTGGNHLAKYSTTTVAECLVGIKS